MPRLFRASLPSAVLAIALAITGALADDVKANKAPDSGAGAVRALRSFLPTPLHKAILARNYLQAKQLIADGAALNADVVNMGVPLALAVMNHDATAIDLLVKAGADVNARSLPDGAEPLEIAARLGSPDTVKLLLDNGADVDAPANDGVTALYMAAKGGALAVVKLLVDHGANMDLPDVNGDTPLHEGAKFTRADIVAFLLERGADVNARNLLGHTPLATALKESPTGPIVDMLRLHGGIE